MGYFIAHKDSKLWRVYEILEKEREKRKKLAKRFIKDRGLNADSVETVNNSIYMNKEDIPEELESEFIIGEKRGRVRKVSDLHRAWLDYLRERYEKEIIHNKETYKLVDFSLDTYVPTTIEGTIDEKKKEIYFISAYDLKYVHQYSHDDLIEEMDEEDYLVKRLAYIRAQKKSKDEEKK